MRAFSTPNGTKKPGRDSRRAPGIQGTLHALSIDFIGRMLVLAGDHGWLWGDLTTAVSDARKLAGGAA